MTKRTWPSVTNRNVAQPSRVRLVNAPDAGSDVFDVIPVPGTVTDEGTLLNKALFDGEKAYVDQNDIPFVTTTGTGEVYLATVPQWNGLTLSELDGRLLTLKCHTHSTSVVPLLNVNKLGNVPLRLTRGNNSSNVAPLPTVDFIQPERNITVKYDSENNYFTIVSTVGCPNGDAFVTIPWSVSGGGTGANTAAGARANLSVPAAYVGTTDNLRLAKSDGNFPEWISVGKTSATIGGLLPNAPSDTGNQHIGTSSWPFIDVWAKTLNGSLAASNVTGILSVGNGGTGVNSIGAFANMFGVEAIGGSNYKYIPTNSDLNTIIQPGTYAHSVDNTASTIKNTPDQYSFRLVVSYTVNNSAYIRQAWQNYFNSGKKWERVSTDGGVTWSSWRVVGNYKPGTGITIDADGTINAIGGGGGGGDYVLPKATPTVLGGIKVGSGLNVATDGTLSTAITAPVSVANGGTGANTAAGARANLQTPTYTVGNINEMVLYKADLTQYTWLLGGTTETASSGFLPRIASVNDGWGFLGANGSPFRELHCKTLNGSLAASSITGVLPISAGGTGGNTAALSRANLGAPSYSLASTGDMSMLTSAGEPVDWISSGNQTTNTGGFMPRVSMSSTGWGSVGTSTYPFAHLYAKNLHGTLSVNDIDGIIPTYRGGTGANTPAAARTNLGIPGTYATGTGTDAQITSAYYIAPKTMVIDMLINVRAITGTGAMVDAGSVTLPVAIRGAVADTSAGFDTVQAPNPAITGGGQALFNFTIVNNKTLKINGWLQSGQNIATQQVNAQIIIPVA